MINKIEELTFYGIYRRLKFIQNKMKDEDNTINNFIVDVIHPYLDLDYDVLKDNVDEQDIKIKAFNFYEKFCSQQYYDIMGNKIEVGSEVYFMNDDNRWNIVRGRVVSSDCCSLNIRKYNSSDNKKETNVKFIKNKLDIDKKNIMKSNHIDKFFYDYFYSVIPILDTTDVIMDYVEENFERIKELKNILFPHLITVLRYAFYEQKDNIISELRNIRDKVMKGEPLYYLIKNFLIKYNYEWLVSNSRALKSYKKLNIKDIIITKSCNFGSILGFTYCEQLPYYINKGCIKIKTIDNKIKYVRNFKKLNKVQIISFLNHN